jgi:hypothetical protein
MAPPTTPKSIYDTIREVKKSIVYLGFQVNGAPQFIGTGFILGASGIYTIATAKHVATANPPEGADEGLHAYYNLRAGGLARRRVDEVAAYGGSWVFHPDDDVDLGVIPFSVDSGRDDLLAVPDNLYLPTSEVQETYETLQLSFDPLVEPEPLVSPVFRSGMVARVNRNKTLYLDGSAFPGNSGSPVFLKPLPSRFMPTGISIGDPLAFKFIGVVGAYIPYQDDAVSRQTGRVRVVFEENTGLSLVWSVDFLRDIQAGRAFSDQVTRLKAIGQPPSASASPTPGPPAVP